MKVTPTIGTRSCSQSDTRTAARAAAHGLPKPVIVFLISTAPPRRRERADQPAAPFAAQTVFDLFGAFAAPQHDHAYKNQRKNSA